MSRQPVEGSRRISTIALVALFFVSICLFVFSYISQPDRPGVRTKEGYYGWWDQSQYLREAGYLAQGVLPPLGKYTYGLGYPSLAVPSIEAGFRGDPFAIPDAIAFGAIVVMAAILGARLLAPGFGLVVAAAIAFATPLLSVMVVPWNNTTSLIAVMAALLVATAARRLGWLAGLVFGSLVGLSFASRYVDAAFPLAIASVSLLRPKNWRALISGILASAILAGLVLYTHKAVFGSPFKTPYSTHMGLHGEPISDQQLAAYDLRQVPRAFLDVFVSGTYRHKREPADPVLGVFPWAVGAPVGLLLLMYRRHKHRLIFLIASTASVLSMILYLSFRGASGDSLKVHSIRYYAPWFPLWAILASYALVVAAGWVSRSDLSPRGDAWSVFELPV